MAEFFSIANTYIDPGEIREIHLPITETANSSYVSIPITVVRGRNKGPTVFLTAGVHGDELNGTLILKRLIDSVHSDQVHGTLVIAPIVNMLGFLNRSRYLPDRRDLNRSFPGNASGSIAARVASRLFKELISKCDMGIDFHTAAEGRDNFPHIRANMKDPVVRKMAKAFGAPVIIDSVGHIGTLRREASRKKIPTILYEGGTANTFQKSIVKAGLNGTLHFLKEMGLVQPKKETKEPSFQIIAKRLEWVRSERGGLLEIKTSPGSIAYKGEPIAVVNNPLGREMSVIRTPFTGLVVGLTLTPIVSPGSPVAHLVELKKTLSTVEKHAKKGKLSTYA